jgi:multisubunit Na+/H+ antiporter MnhE subunit
LSISTTIETAPRRRHAARGFVLASVAALGLWMLGMATLAMARPGEGMVVAIGAPASLLRDVDPDRIRLVRVGGIFVLAAVSGREGVKALYGSGALIVLPGSRGGCGLAL